MKAVFEKPLLTYSSVATLVLVGLGLAANPSERTPGAPAQWKIGRISSHGVAPDLSGNGCGAAHAIEATLLALPAADRTGSEELPFTVELKNRTERARSVVYSLAVYEDTGDALIPPEPAPGLFEIASNRAARFEHGVPSRLPDGYYYSELSVASSDKERSEMSSTTLYFSVKEGTAEVMDVAEWITESNVLVARPLAKPPRVVPQPSESGDVP